MRFLRAKRFDKQLAKSSRLIQKRTQERLLLFTQERYHELLNNHALNGKYQGYRSINITGDWRLIFEEIRSDTIRLLDVDTHHNLYGI